MLRRVEAVKDRIMGRTICVTHLKLSKIQIKLHVVIQHQLMQSAKVPLVKMKHNVQNHIMR